MTHAATWEQIFYLQTPSPDPGGGVKIKLFSEPGHVAHQIKGNGTCSDMVAKSPDLGWGQKVKIQLFQNMVM